VRRHIAESWLWLLFFDIVILFRGLRVLYWIVRKQGVRMITPGGRYSSSAVCQAIDLACILYFKEVKCLQRSAVATVMLRRNGWRAQMVVGAQLLPLQNHAWTEVDNEVVNDKPYMNEIYQVLERC
jgi:Transglutaminase-like superfamily